MDRASTRFLGQPHLFANALARELSLAKGILLHYIVDLLINSETKQDLRQNTFKALYFLEEEGK